MIDVAAAAKGHWKSILLDLGVDARHLKINTVCPVCPESKDRFSFTDKGSGLYYCRAGHSGDGFKLLGEIYGWDFPKAAAEVGKVLGQLDEKPKRDRKRDPSKLLNAVYKGSKPVYPGCAVERYLQARGLSVLPETLRYHPSLELGRESYPAMVAVLSDVTGQAVSLHRTYLEGDHKAPVETPKMLMTPKGTVNGSAVRLWPATDTVGLSEGLETGIACFELFNLPVWPCISSGGLERIVLPESIRNVVIFGDNDAHKHYEGQRAAFAAAARLSKEGRRVEVKICPIPGMDFLDELVLQRGKR